MILKMLSLLYLSHVTVTGSIFIIPNESEFYSK